MVSWLKEKSSYDLNDLWTQDQGEIYLLEVQTHLPSHSCRHAVSMCMTSSIEFSLLRKTNLFGKPAWGICLPDGRAFNFFVIWPHMHTAKTKMPHIHTAKTKIHTRGNTNRPGRQTASRRHSEQRSPIWLKGGGWISDGNKPSEQTDTITQPAYVKPLDNDTHVRKQSLTNYGFCSNF